MCLQRPRLGEQELSERSAKLSEQMEEIVQHAVDSVVQIALHRSLQDYLGWFTQEVSMSSTHLQW